MFCDFIFITASQIVQGKVTSDEKFLFSLDSQVNIEILYTGNNIVVNVLMRIEGFEKHCHVIDIRVRF